MATARAPNPISNIDYVNEPLGRAMINMPLSDVARFLELVEMRADTHFDHPNHRGRFIKSMLGLGKPAMRQWASGFSHARQKFKSAGPRNQGPRWTGK